MGEGDSHYEESLYLSVYSKVVLAWERKAGSSGAAVIVIVFVIVLYLPLSLYLSVYSKVVFARERQVARGSGASLGAAGRLPAVGSHYLHCTLSNQINFSFIAFL